jgi:ABC-2 type transport system permease protein
MGKYLTIIKVFWQRALVYRFSVVAYRVGELSEMLVLILMWSAIYRDQEFIGGLSLEEMITYILIGNFFNAVIRNFLSNVVARQIKEGSLSIFLVQPISYFKYTLFREIGRISFSTIMSVFSMMVVIVLFNKIFIWHLDIPLLIIIVVMIFLAFVTELLLSYLIGLIAFWTDEVDGIYSTIERVKRFFSGGYFPINLLPLLFLKMSFALPFAYTFFVPAQLYLKKLEPSVGLRGLLVQVIWIAILYAIIQVVWHRGLKRYEGVGI